MSLFGWAPKGRQMAALIRKNLIITVTRRPIGFLFSMYALPLAILAVLLSIPAFFTTADGHGLGDPTPIHKLADILDQKLVIVKPPGLGSDVDAAIERLIKPLNKDLIIQIDDDQRVATECAANSYGASNCFAAVTFMDSPETKQQPNNSWGVDHHTWEYIFRTDQARSSVGFNVETHTSSHENTNLPLVLAVNNAIADRDDQPSAFGYTSENLQIQKELTLVMNIRFMSQFYLFIIFMASFILIIYRCTAKLTRDRDTGVSQLIDSMGDRGAITSRILSWLLVFDLVTLPCYIIGGILYWHIRFPSSNVGVLIGWQILLGLAINSSTVFAASFFSKARVSAIYVCGGFVLLAIGTQVFSTQKHPLPFHSAAVALTLLFPSANFVLFIQQMFLWELLKQPARLNEIPKSHVGDLSIGLNSESYSLTQGTLLGFLVFQIIAYPLLAILVEWYMHGISFSSRSFNQDREVAAETRVVETRDLKKRFLPNIFARIFCCGTRPSVKAVDGVSIQGYQGQILCLVGPNGSGKTTTLHMMAGFIGPTSGDVTFNAAPSQIGICPQRNTLWDELTVREHVSIWSQIKGGVESKSEIDELIAACDLTPKRDSQARALSGGQKRKLQLACMFVGGSSVCLIDECTSGLDPLSRRVIWDILLQQRSKRSIIFTTHFLDEVDVLADHIVILCKGKVKCHGAVTELKNSYGNGYQVLVPHAAESLNVAHGGIRHQDRILYSVPDSHSAMQLSTKFAAAGVTDVTIAGPQVEDVFLNVADDVELLNETQSPTDNGDGDAKLSPGNLTSFWSQVGTIYRKRWTVFWRLWWPYLFAVAIPIIAVPFLRIMMENFQLQPCYQPESRLGIYAPRLLQRDSRCGTEQYYGCSTVAVGPPSVNDTLYKMEQDDAYALSQVDPAQFQYLAQIYETMDRWRESYKTRGYNTAQGFFLPSDSSPDTMSFALQGSSVEPYDVLNLMLQAKSRVEIVPSSGEISYIEHRFVDIGIIYAVLFSLLQALYPATFVLYPAMEKARKVRAIEYANGVRRAPLWTAYVLFDLLPVVIIGAALTAILVVTLPWVGTALIMLPILILYGLAAILLGYVISHFFNGPLKSFLMAFLVNIVMFALAALAFGLGFAKASPIKADEVSTGIVFGVNLVLPIGNVFQALLLGLNVGQTRCSNGQFLPMDSIRAFGGPILYLVLQVLFLLGIIIWIEGDLALFRRKSSKKTAKRDDEKSIVGATSDDAEQERLRVETADSDLLRILNFTKSFGSNKAVDNVTLGLPQSDVTALIGPNGAGKSTLVNLIQSEPSPDSGQAYICGEDWRTRSAQGRLGVCPQFDALDLMNTRQHLTFFARIKGVKDVKANVDRVMARLGLTPHAKTLATKLSGGNKRKLSLAIAVMGAPPVLVLDEPTSAMDAVGKRAFWKIIKSIAPDHSVLLTTHSMEEANHLATRAAILSRRLLAVGTTQTLREKYSNVYHVNIMLTSSPGSTPEEMENIRTFVHDNVPSAKLERDMLGGQVRFTIDAGRGSNVMGLITLLEENKQALGIEYYSIGAATLETVFLSVVRANNVQEEDGVVSYSWGERLTSLF